MENKVFLNLQHTRFASEARVCEPDVLWVGDSIVQNLVNSQIWARSFCQMHRYLFREGADNLLIK